MVMPLKLTVLQLNFHFHLKERSLKIPYTILQRIFSQNENNMCIFVSLSVPGGRKCFHIAWTLQVTFPFLALQSWPNYI